MNEPAEGKGAIVLCGGRSTRMGTSKAMLPFGPECMLQRVVRLIQNEVRHIVVVAAAEQDLPELPPHIIVARDRRQSQGPLEGLYAGLRAMPPGGECVYATSCDVPFLVPAFVRRLFSLLGEQDVVVPVEDRFHHPLSAVYRRSVGDTVETLLAENQRRPLAIYDRVKTRRVPIDELRDVDPRLLTLENLNTPQQYRAALREAQIPLTPEIERRLGE